jgi:hypothetical protein
MALTRIKGAGWSFGEKLTSAQTNALDISHANAIDKRAGALEIGTASITRVVPYVWTPRTIANWSTDVTTGLWTTFINSVATIACNFRLPDGATLNSVAVWIDPTDGHAGLPATMPFINVESIDPDHATPVTLLATATDTSANASAFDALHAITASTIGHAASPSTVSYRISLWTESGSNAMSNCIVRGAIINFTCARLDEW